MDATKRPLSIPPEISNYAEKHGIFDLHKVLIGVMFDMCKLITISYVAFSTYITVRYCGVA